jgi:hypothetical protein
MPGFLTRGNTGFFILKKVLTKKLVYKPRAAFPKLQFWEIPYYKIIFLIKRELS